MVAEKLFKGKKDSYLHSVKEHFVDSRLGMFVVFILSQLMTKPTIRLVRPMNTQISLRTCAV